MKQAIKVDIVLGSEDGQVTYSVAKNMLGELTKEDITKASDKMMEELIKISDERARPHVSIK